MLRATAVKIVYSLNKQFLDVSTNPEKYKRAHIRPKFFDPEYLTLEKNWSWSDSNPGPLPSQVYTLSPR